MWVEHVGHKKYKYIERYIDPLTEKKKKVSVTLTSNSRQAWNQANLLLTKKINNKLELKEVCPTTFGELKAKWDEKYKPTVKSSSYKTSQGYINLISEFIPDDALVKNVTRNMIQDMLDTCYFDRDLSYNYVLHLKTFTGMIFKFANIRYGLDYNPVTNVRLSRKPKTQEDIKNEKEKFLTKEEVMLLVDAQRNLFQQIRYSLITKFLFLSGIRYGEMIALTESDYDGKSIVIAGTYDYENKVKTTTKTMGSYRKVDLPQAAVEILNKLILENKMLFGKENKYIFTTSENNPISVQAYNSSLRSSAKSIGLDRKVSSHVLRHSHISLLTELGVPLKAIMDRVGHEDSKTTLRIYTHTTKNMQEDLIDKLDNILI